MACAVLCGQPQGAYVFRVVTALVCPRARWTVTPSQPVAMSPLA